MHVTRIFTDPGGESHFEDVETGLSPIDVAPPAPPLKVSPPLITAQIVFVEFPAGWLGDWHPAPRRQYWVGIHGTAEVTVSDGERREFGPGSVALLEDLVGKGHLTRAMNDRPVRAMLVHL